MKPLTRALAMLALAALLVGLLAAAVIARSDHVDDATFAAVFMVGVGFVWIATGLFAWHRRPANKAGALMTWTGFLWLVNAFVAANSPAIFTFAVLASNLYLGVFVHLLLAYPEGTLRRRIDRRLAAAVYALCAARRAPDPAVRDPGRAKAARRASSRSRARPRSATSATSSRASRPSRSRAR